MLHKVVLLIIAHSGYHPLEYGLTRKALADAGIHVVVASDALGIADATPSAAHQEICKEAQCMQIVKDYPEYAQVQVDLQLADITIDAYDGIFIIGGPGAMEFLDNQVSYTLIEKIAQSGKPFGAICVSPRVLARAEVLKGKKVTGWNGDHLLAGILNVAGAEYIQEAVVIDGMLITANGPDAAQEFGKAIVTMLQS